jgi:hypothetical protein
VRRKRMPKRKPERHGWKDLDAANRYEVAESMSHFYRKTGKDPTMAQISRALGEPVRKERVSGQGDAAPED